MQQEVSGAKPLRLPVPVAQLLPHIRGLMVGLGAPQAAETLGLAPSLAAAVAAAEYLRQRREGRAARLYSVRERVAAVPTPITRQRIREGLAVLRLVTQPVAGA